MKLEDLEKISLGLCEGAYVYNGKHVPRVTNILGKTIHEDYLMQWSNSLGFKRKSYSKTLKIMGLNHTKGWSYI